MLRLFGFVMVAAFQFWGAGAYAQNASNCLVFRLATGSYPIIENNCPFRVIFRYIEIGGACSPQGPCMNDVSAGQRTQIYGSVTSQYRWFACSYENYISGTCSLDNVRW